MDPLTHSLVGAALARTRLGRSTRLAGAALILGANLPDVDVVSFVAGSDGALGFRRGWTHGPLAILILPVVLTGLLLGWEAWIRRRGSDLPRAGPARLLGLSYLACLTHPVLDWLNTYGVRLLMPFDDRWYYGDAVFIIDPWLWLLLGGAVFLGSPGRGVSRWWLLLAIFTSLLMFSAASVVPLASRAVWIVGLGLIALLRCVPAVRARAVRTATIGLTLASLYLFAMIATTAIASVRVRAELARQGVGEVRRLMVGPMPANPFSWDVLAETALFYRYGSFRWLPRPVLELDADRIDKPRPSPVLDAALAAPRVRGAVIWMRFPFVEIEETPDGYTVYLLDARYVRSRTRGFGAAVIELDRQLQLRPN